MNADFWIKIVLCCFDIFKEIKLYFNYLLDKRLLTCVLNISENLKYSKIIYHEYTNCRSKFDGNIIVIKFIMLHILEIIFKREFNESGISEAFMLNL